LNRLCHCALVLTGHCEAVPRGRVVTSWLGNGDWYIAGTGERFDHNRGTTVESHVGVRVDELQGLRHRGAERKTGDVQSSRLSVQGSKRQGGIVLKLQERRHLGRLGEERKQYLEEDGIPLWNSVGHGLSGPVRLSKGRHSLDVPSLKIPQEKGY